MSPEPLRRGRARRRQRARDAAFTVVEVVVALGLLAVSALALTQSLMAAQRLQWRSGCRMRAMRLAEEALERGGAADGGGADTTGPFRRSWSASPTGGELALRQVEVIVEWDDPAPQRLALRTVVRR